MARGFLKAIFIVLPHLHNGERPHSEHAQADTALGVSKDGGFQVQHDDNERRLLSGRTGSPSSVAASMLQQQEDVPGKYKAPNPPKAFDTEGKVESSGDDQVLTMLHEGFKGNTHPLESSSKAGKFEYKAVPDYKEVYGGKEAEWKKFYGENGGIVASNSYDQIKKAMRETEAITWSPEFKVKDYAAAGEAAYEKNIDYHKKLEEYVADLFKMSGGAHKVTDAEYQTHRAQTMTLQAMLTHVGQFNNEPVNTEGKEMAFKDIQKMPDGAGVNKWEQPFLKDVGNLKSDNTGEHMFKFGGSFAPIHGAKDKQDLKLTEAAKIPANMMPKGQEEGSK